MAKTTTTYRPELDVLRLLAFAMVFLHHVGLRQGAGWFVMDACGFGLPLFFTLSAFLIGGNLLAEIERTGALSLSSFYTRRALRIWPLYYAFLLSYVAIAGAFGFLEHRHVAFLTALLTFTGNLYYASGLHPWNGSAAEPLWSLSTEEQFYLLFPLLVVACRRRGLWIAGSIALVVAVAVQGRLAAVGADRDVTIWTNPLVQGEFFAIGSLLALALGHRPLALPAPARVALGIATLLLWVAASRFTACKHFGAAPSALPLVLGYQMIGLGCAAAILACHGYPRRLPSILVALGRMSFGLYVFHLVGLGLARAITGETFGPVTIGLALAMTITMAAVSYRYLEAPCLRLKDRLGRGPGYRATPDAAVAR